MQAKQKNKQTKKKKRLNNSKEQHLKDSMLHLGRDYDKL